MELFKKQTNINFMGYRKFSTLLSLGLCLMAIMVILIKGINFGLDFTGGTQIELRFSEQVDPVEIRRVLESKGFDDVRTQHYGTMQDVIIRLANIPMDDESKLSDKIASTLQSEQRSVEIRRVEFVGAEVGEHLAEQGGMAVLVAILATMVYIALRFEYRFALSAALALSHDSLLVLGIFSFFQIEFDLATLAALLAVVGYSLNDTIVVFDRVRESFRKVRRGTVEDIINLSINQTLSRTLMTSWLTLLVILALLFFGGESLHGFSLALALGIVIGTYSSIYVAGALAVNLGLSRADMLPRPKAELDDMP